MTALEGRAQEASVGCALAVTSGVLAKIALDVLLLAQTEVAEVSEAGGAGRGGSSTLPHKRNPVSAVLVTACTKRLPGLAATLLPRADRVSRPCPWPS